MLPVALDLSKIPVLLIGEGVAFEKRKAQLEELGAKRLSVSSWPVPASLFKEASLILIAGLDHATSQAIAAQARAQGKLVNAEDMNELCDFYYTAHIRRGDLLIAVTTGGASPTLAKKVRDVIGQQFGEKWAHYTKEISHARQAWKNEGKSLKDIAQLTEEWLKKKGWFA